MKSLDISLSAFLSYTQAPDIYDSKLKQKSSKSASSAATSSKLPSRGGDFYAAFWADAKKHVLEGKDLRTSTANRIQINPKFRVLHNKMTDNFVEWWEQELRTNNTPFAPIALHMNSNHELSLELKIKVHGLLGIRFGDDGDRAIYAYFNKDIPLEEWSARIGLSVMSKCIQDHLHKEKDMRILDVVHGRSFSTSGKPTGQSDDQRLQESAAAIVTRWSAINSDFGHADTN